MSDATPGRGGRGRPGRSGAAVEVRRPRVALGVTGGIAAYKSAEVVRGLVKAGCDVQVLMTGNAQKFITPLTLQTLSGQRVLSDPWDLSQGSDIQHIASARGLDLFIVAPATADILSKMAHGIADDFLTTFHLAVTAPILLAPAMNVWMWEHPATQANLELLRRRGARIIDPGVGDLACGDEGIGRMAEPDAVVSEALRLLKKKARAILKAVASS